MFDFFRQLLADYLSNRAIALGREAVNRQFIVLWDYICVCQLSIPFSERIQHDGDSFGALRMYRIQQQAETSRLNDNFSIRFGIRYYRLHVKFFKSP
jgi:hypothetical protein